MDRKLKEVIFKDSMIRNLDSETHKGIKILGIELNLTNAQVIKLLYDFYRDKVDKKAS